MPLLTSPIDGSPMRQVHRFGVEFDVCPTSGGVWLDKGELEKIMVMIREEAAEDASRSARAYNRDRDYDDDDDDRRRGGHGSRGRRSKLFDLFDF
ncbi:hypothetical protein GC169_04560 [bacterium]|nr:hypothetical protein [bacterium]